MVALPACWMLPDREHDCNTFFMKVLIRVVYMEPAVSPETRVHPHAATRAMVVARLPRPKSIINGSPLSRSMMMFWMGSTIITSCLRQLTEATLSFKRQHALGLVLISATII